jgi:hypothetical protein
MKNLPALQTKIIISMCFAFFICISASGQDNAHITPKIKMMGVNGELQLTCEEGCAWKTLSFSIAKGHKQLVNEYGMLSHEELSDEPNDPTLARFTFEASKNKRGQILVKAVEGLSFKTVKFNKNVMVVDI